MLDYIKVEKTLQSIVLFLDFAELTRSDPEKSFVERFK